MVSRYIRKIEGNLRKRGKFEAITELSWIITLEHPLTNKRKYFRWSQFNECLRASQTTIERNWSQLIIY